MCSCCEHSMESAANQKHKNTAGTSFTTLKEEGGGGESRFSNYSMNTETAGCLFLKFKGTVQHFWNHSFGFFSEGKMKRSDSVWGLCVKYRAGVRVWLAEQHPRLTWFARYRKRCWSLAIWAQEDTWQPPHSAQTVQCAVDLATSQTPAGGSAHLNTRLSPTSQLSGWVSGNLFS